ncbi:selenoprotein V-like isoform X2 [Numida meleagris]|nr:selenoprotein V-like isoform X2 [Numida meleagris]XP_021239651.1 selenoprotein V-like isoform X2 [Numida meleagris]XP_021239652.1 selenoprotein V-like isoform X2 [Numida meleagris]
MGAPRTVGVLLVLLALLRPHGIGVTARTLPVPVTVPVPTTAPVPVTVPSPVPDIVPTATAVPTAATVPDPVEEVEEEMEEEEEDEGHALSPLELLSRRRDPDVPESLLEIVPELRDLLSPSSSPSPPSSPAGGPQLPLLAGAVPCVAPRDP